MCYKPAMKKHLLFVTYGGGHVHMVYPVVHALRQKEGYKRGQLAIHILALTGARPILQANDVECVGFHDYLDHAKDADAIRWGTQLAKDNHSSTIGITVDESIAYMGLCYKDLVLRHGEQEAARLYGEHGRNAFLPLTVLERVFDDIQPNFVIATNSPRSEAAAIDVANQRGIDNMVMTDLFTSIGGYYIRARHVTFLNHLAQTMFTTDGYVDPDISTFYITGNPAMDMMCASPKTKTPGWMATHFPESAGKTVVLHIDMHAYWDPERQCGYYKTDADTAQELDVVYQAARKNNAFYIVRPHPSQDRTVHLAWLTGKPDAQLGADCDLVELLRNADLVVVRTSTVGLQAAYMRKRVLQLSADFHTDMPLATMGVAWGANSYDEVEPVMRRALTDDEEASGIRRITDDEFPLVPAADRIADIILDCLFGTQLRRGHYA